MTDDAVERVARALWQAQSERAAGRRRLSDWNDESEKTRNEWRFMARAAIAALQAERRMQWGTQVPTSREEATAMKLLSEQWFKDHPVNSPD